MPEIPSETWSAGVAVAILATAALTQGFFGFGFGIIAMTGLTLSQDVIHAAGVVNVTGLALTGSLFLRLRREVLWRVLRPLVPALLVGVAIGVTALSRLDGALLVRLLGATIVAIALWNLASPRLHPTESRLRAAAMGLLAGLLGGAFNTGGPPLVAYLYARHEAILALKATVQATFFVLGLTRLPLAIGQGLIDAAVWRDALVAAPLVVLASLTGVALAGRVASERFRNAAWIALAGLGAALLLSG